MFSLVVDKRKWAVRFSFCQRKWICRWRKGSL